MSALFGRSSAQFDKLLEKATSHLLLEPDWDAILQICDCIRQGDVQPKYAMSCIKKKLYAPNPHVVLYTLQVLESCVKNCGAPIHAEIASRPFMEELRDVVKNTTNDNVKNRILELVQVWAYAFRNQPKYRAVQDIFNLLRMEGYKLQVLKESDAMFVADTAPDWAEGDCCHRCRVQFSVVQRKHHCRNCGQIFCQKCSPRNAPIPRFGIEKEVRVCEACWENLSKPSGTPKSGPSSVESSPKQSSTAPSSNSAGGKSEQELKEEEELQLALALSQSEAECKEQLTPAPKSQVQAAYMPPEDTETIEPLKKGILTSGDSELDRYLNRQYWEQRQQNSEESSVVQSEKRSSPIPSAPVVSTSGMQSVNVNKVSEKYQNGDTDEMAEFVTTLRTSLEIFVNRLKSNSSRGRPIANDTYVQSQFMNITNMHAQLLKYIQEQEDARAYYESLQDKLNQIRDARAALDALREEHQEKLRREAEEAERQRQIQMAHKLEIMRKKKQEYLQYQRQLAIQRVQEQEREMQLRHEQQKQQYHSMGPGPSSATCPPQQPQLPQPYGPAPQGYVVNDPSVPGPAINQQAYPPTFRPPVVGSAMGPVHMQAVDYQQPFNVQNVPHPGPFPQPQPQPVVNSNASVVAPAQNPAMIMHPGMMGHMPAHMIPSQTLPHQNISIPHVQGNMVQMVPQQDMHHMMLGRPEHAVPPLSKEDESQPLIVFD